MADFRNVHTHMWVSDEWFAELETAAKLLWIFLFTNQTASVAGIYRLPLRVICFGTGLEPTDVRRLMADFECAGKIMWDGEIVWVKKMRSYQTQGNPVSIAKCIARDLERIPDGAIKLAYQSYQNGTTLPPACPQDGTIVSPLIIRDETTPNPTPRKSGDDAKPAAAADPAFAELWKLLTNEHIVTNMGDVLRDDVSEIFAECSDGRVWREAVRRAKAKDSRGANWAFVRSIMVAYMRTGSWDKPGTNAHGPPVVKPESIGAEVISAILEADNGKRKARTAKGPDPGGP